MACNIEESPVGSCQAPGQFLTGLTINLQARSAPHSLGGYFPTPGDGSREDQFLVTNEDASMVPPLIRTHSPAIVSEAVLCRASELTRIQYSHSTVVRNPFASGGLPTEARSGRYNPHAEARPHHTHKWSDSTTTLAGPSRERTDVLRHADFLNYHDHGDGGARDEGRLAELPPDLRSDGLPNRPTRAQSRRNTRRTMQITSPDKAVPAPKRTRRRRTRGLKDPIGADVSFHIRVRGQ